LRKLREVLRNISKKATVKYLIPMSMDRLYVGYLYTKAGAEVCYYPLVSDLRYTVIDDEFVIIGVPEEKGKSEPTKKGYNIPSEDLGRLLKEHFYSCWKDGISYEDYMRETLNETNASPRQLGQELQIDEKEIERISLYEEPI